MRPALGKSQRGEVKALVHSNVRRATRELAKALFLGAMVRRFLFPRYEEEFPAFRAVRPPRRDLSIQLDWALRLTIPLRLKAES